MARLLTMPELAAAAGEATLDEWAVAEGGEFASGDVVATVETDKAIAEVAADAAGVVVRHLVPSRALVDVGAPIAVLGDRGETVDVDAFLTTQGVTDAVGPEPRSAQPPPTDSTPAPAVPDGPAAAPRGGGHRIFISPLARRLAAEAGLGAEQITGTGPHGRITRRDVLLALEERENSRPQPASTVSAAVTPNAAAAGFREIPHDRMRRAIAGRLTASKQQAPHFYVKATIEVGELLKLRATLNERSAQRISVNDLVVKAVGGALVRVPELNVAWYDDAVRQFAHADVGMAVATERGLLTPVLRSVDSLGLAALAHNSAELRERAENGRLRQGDLEGGSICVSNLGMFGIEEFTAIINPPQAAILAVGAVRESVVVSRSVPVVAKVMTVVLSVDHRPVDGVTAAHWMREFTALIEQPQCMLL
ncbi:2-oxo acid dehydrogenase subunit E2 [Streptomyces sp. NPDC102360]|uniref:2-oxo acid dehydrogenase subunit E2 n=1 Tax=Streptomyces sp. NPDC102360 TaxID=3366160 RepID=UPI0038021344